ncbi:hypothetical protein M8J77_006986 [Diaphorina citri]|nr:hypothetical protein M8J77_006986 [Diaphorina citri]
MEAAMLEIVEELKKLRTDFNVEQQETRKMIEDKFNNEKAEINGKIEKHDGRIKNLEKKHRRRNIIIYGLNEDDNENFTTLKDKVNWLFNEKMELNIKIEEIDDFFRLGKKRDEGKIRPIIIKMISSWRKNEIMNNRRKLKGTRIFIENDMSEEEMEEKKNMIAEMRELKSKGHDAYIKGRTLIVKKENERKNGERSYEGTSSQYHGKVSNETIDMEITTEEQNSSQMNNTIYQTPLNTPGKRYVSQRSPGNKKEGKQGAPESALKKKKIQQLQRTRAHSEGQRTLESMFTRSEKSKNDENSDNDTRNIAYVSIVHDSAEKKEARKDDDKKEDQQI